MNLRKILMFGLKITILTIIMFFLFVLGNVITSSSQSDSSQLTQQEQTRAALSLIIVCFVDVLLLSFLILRSRLHGLRLIVIVALVYYGVKTIMSQIETWYFMQNVTPEMLQRLFLMTIPITLFFPPIAVVIWGKFKIDSFAGQEDNTRLVMPVKDWIWKLLLLSVIVYPILYFGFGYFVAWQNPEVRDFYGGSSTYSSNVINHYINTFSNNPWFYPFQIFRGLLWLGLALPIIRWTKGGVWEIGLLISLLFSLLMNDVHLIPNPLMPATVRLLHFIETASSNFIWGSAIVGLLLWRPIYKKKKMV